MSASRIGRSVGVLLVEGGEVDARWEWKAANHLNRSERFRPAIGTRPLDDRVD